MKKISLKLNIEHLDVINRVIDVFNKSPRPDNKDTKMAISIIEELSGRLAKKAITERQNNKAFKISLKYYEAYTLEWLLRSLLNSLTDGQYERNVMLLYANKINQQL